jgi:hypothetical protein
MRTEVTFQERKLREFTFHKQVVNNFYVCPVCGDIAQGWFYNERIATEDESTLEAGEILREFGLMCKHRWRAIFPNSPLSFVPQSRRRVHHHAAMDISVSFETKQKDGRVTQRLWQRSESLLNNFACQLTCEAENAALTGGLANHLTSQDITTTAVTTGYNVGMYYFGGLYELTTSAASGSVLYGMAVGTGSPTVAPSDGALTQPCKNGTTAGGPPYYLQYGAESYTLPAIVGSTTTWVDARLFTNNSGAQITVTEVGLFAVTSISSANYAMMIIHDKLAASVPIAQGASTTGAYTYTITS